MFGGHRKSDGSAARLTLLESSPSLRSAGPTATPHRLPDTGVPFQAKGPQRADGGHLTECAPATRQRPPTGAPRGSGPRLVAMRSAVPSVPPSSCVPPLYPVRDTVTQLRVLDTRKVLAAVLPAPHARPREEGLGPVLLCAEKDTEARRGYVTACKSHSDGDHGGGTRTRVSESRAHHPAATVSVRRTVTGPRAVCSLAPARCPPVSLWPGRADPGSARRTQKAEQ